MDSAAFRPSDYLPNYCQERVVAVLDQEVDSDYVHPTVVPVVRQGHPAADMLVDEHPVAVARRPGLEAQW